MINGFICLWVKELGEYNIWVVGVVLGIMEVIGLRICFYEEVLVYIWYKIVDDIWVGYKSMLIIFFGWSGKLLEVVDVVNYLLLECVSYIIGVMINVVGGKSCG